jgi:hypothetical protein
MSRPDDAFLAIVVHRGCGYDRALLEWRQAGLREGGPADAGSQTRIIELSRQSAREPMRPRIRRGATL